MKYENAEALGETALSRWTADPPRRVVLSNYGKSVRLFSWAMAIGSFVIGVCFSIQSHRTMSALQTRGVIATGTLGEVAHYSKAEVYHFTFEVEGKTWSGEYRGHPLPTTFPVTFLPNDPQTHWPAAPITDADFSDADTAGTALFFMSLVFAFAACLNQIIGRRDKRLLERGLFANARVESVGWFVPGNKTRRVKFIFETRNGDVIRSSKHLRSKRAKAMSPGDPLPVIYDADRPMRCLPLAAADSFEMP